MALLSSLTVATSTSSGDKFYLTQSGVDKQIDYDDMPFGGSSPIEGVSPDELIFDKNYLYTDAVGDKDWTISSIGNSSEKKLITIYKSINTTNTVTLDLSEYNINIIGDGWLEDNGVWTLDKATSSDYDAVCVLELFWDGGEVVKATSSWSEKWSIEFSPFVFEFFDGDRGVNTSGTATWTGQKAGTILSASGFTNPTHNSSAWEFNGTNQAFEEGGTLASMLMQSLNDEALTIYIVKEKKGVDVGSAENIASMYSTITTNEVVSIQDGSLEECKFIVRDSLSNNTTAIGGNTTPNVFEVIVSSLDTSNVSVALNDDVLTSVANSFTGDFNGIDRFAICYRDLGSQIYYSANIKAIVIANGIGDRNRIYNELVSKYSL